MQRRNAFSLLGVSLSPILWVKAACDLGVLVHVVSYEAKHPGYVNFISSFRPNSRRDGQTNGNCSDKMPT